MEDTTKTKPFHLLFWTLFLLFLLSLVPLLLLGLYDVPWADDFSYGANAHRAFLQGASLWQILNTAWHQVKNSYMTWQGTFSAIFLMSLQPAVFGERFYTLVPFLMLLALVGGTFALSQAIFTGVMRFPRPVSGIAAILICVLCIQLLPSAADSFYWFNGAVYYTFYHGIFLLTIALSLRFLARPRKGRLLLLSFLGIVLGGGNYVTALGCAVAAVSGLLLLAILRNRQWKALLLPVILFFLSFAVSMLAPGNVIRQASINYELNALQAILLSFRGAFIDSLRWFRLPVVGVLLVLAVLIWPLFPTLTFSFRYPVLVTLYSYCFLSALYCPSFYAMGNIGGARILNILYDSYCFLLCLNLVYWLGWFSRTLGKRRKPVAVFSLWKTALAFLLCLVCFALYLRSGFYTSIAALGAYGSEEMEVYRQESAVRFEILNSEEKDVVIPPYSYYPFLVCKGDYSEDPSAWINRCLCVFYDKNNVICSN